MLMATSQPARALFQESRAADRELHRTKWHRSAGTRLPCAKSRLIPLTRGDRYVPPLSGGGPLATRSGPMGVGVAAVRRHARDCMLSPSFQASVVVQCCTHLLASRSLAKGKNLGQRVHWLRARLVHAQPAKRTRSARSFTRNHCVCVALVLVGPHAARFGLTRPGVWQAN